MYMNSRHVCQVSGLVKVFFFQLQCFYALAPTQIILAGICLWVLTGGYITLVSFSTLVLKYPVKIDYVSFCQYSA